MKNQYFLKDKKVTVYKREPSYKDDYGVSHSGGIRPITPSPLWCYAKQTSQTIGVEDGKFYLNSESRFFVFNYNKKIVQDCLIKYRDTWFSVKRVDTTDDYNGDMFVYVEDTALGDIPKDRDILSYKA